MADFCRECTERILGIEGSDFDCMVAQYESIQVLCEGCGFIEVDHAGRRLAFKGSVGEYIDECVKRHPGEGEPDVPQTHDQWGHEASGWPH